MKTNQTIFVLGLAVLSLTACQQAKVSEQTSSALQSNTSGGSSSGGSTSGGVISGSVIGTSTNVMDVATPTPSPSVPVGGAVIAPSASYKKPSVPFLLLSFVKLISTEATAAPMAASAVPVVGPGIVVPALSPANLNSPNFEIFGSSKLISSFQAAVGSSAYLNYQSKYMNYISALALNPSAPVPAELLVAVNLSFLSSFGATASISLKAIDILVDNAAVIMNGNKLYYGKGLIPASGASAAVDISLLGSVKYFKNSSSTLVGVGGLSSGFNKNIFNISFYAASASVPASFEISNYSTITAPAAGITKIRSAMVTDSAFASAVTGASINHHVVIAYANASGEISKFYLYNLSNPLVPPALISPTCSSIVSKFPGLSCLVAVVGGGGALPQ